MRGIGAGLHAVIQRVEAAADSLTPRSRIRLRVVLAVLLAAHLLLVSWGTGLPWHDLLIDVLLAALAGNRRTLAIAGYLLPLWVLSVAYGDVLPMLLAFRPPIHVADLYALELKWFGTGSGAGRQILPALFAEHHAPLCDVVCGLVYLCDLPQIAPLALYFFWREPARLSWFLWAFVGMHLVGFAIWVAYPAAPPWYVLQYGLGPVQLDAPSDPAGLARLDAIFGVPLTASYYAQSSNVFGAMPSMHAAAAVFCALYAWRLNWRIGTAWWCFAAVTCFGAVYLVHHYVLDVLAGAALAVVSWLIAEKSYRWRGLRFCEQTGRPFGQPPKASEGSTHEVVSRSSQHGSPRRCLRPAVEIGAVLLLFVAYAAWPTPDSGESQYLTKAKHFWDPSWCAEDFFLRTADAHLVFYRTVGWLTACLPLPIAAWTGRLVCWTLLAAAWRELGVVLRLPFVATLLAAGWFLLFSNACKVSGEWIVGGLEAKGFAWALVWFAAANALRGRWPVAVVLAGAATAFHVLVGGWFGVVLALTWVQEPFASARTRPMRLALAVSIGAALALAGLIPAWQLDAGADPATRAEAARIYVFERLAHHLLPDRFPSVCWLFLIPLTLWLVLTRILPRDIEWRRLRRLVNLSLGVAMAGLTVRLCTYHQPMLSAGWMRFYWFRLADGLLPMGAALLLGHTGLQCWRRFSCWRRLLLAALLLPVVAHSGGLLIWRWTHPNARSEKQMAQHADWHRVCAWAAEHTPPDAVFLTPWQIQTFRWHSGRAEVATFKDVPQDAAGVVRWWQRLNGIHGTNSAAGKANWHLSLTELGRDRLLALGKQSGARYVVTEAAPSLALPRVGPRDACFAIYELDEATLALPASTAATRSDSQSITPANR